MALPTINRPVPVALPLPPRPAPTPAQTDADAPASEQAGSTHARRPGMLATAMNMQDDLGALVATLQRRRDNAAASRGDASAAWIDHVLDEQASHKLAGFRQALQGVRGGAAVLLALKGLFADASDMLAVLRALLGEEEMKAMHAELADALEQLLAEQQALGQGGAMRGGANVAVKARLASRSGMLGARTLRQAYRDFLLATDALGQYAAWMALHGPQQRYRVLEFIEQALAVDMFALDPSGTQREFGVLLHRVRQLATLRSVDQVLLRECTRLQLVARGLVACNDTLVQGLIKVVRGLQDWAGLFGTALPAVRTVLTAGERAQLVHALHRAVHALPDAAWADASAREEVLQALAPLLAASTQRERRQQPGRPELRA